MNSFFSLYMTGAENVAVVGDEKRYGNKSNVAVESQMIGGI